MVLTKDKIKEVLKDDLEQLNELVRDIDKLLEFKLKADGLTAYGEIIRVYCREGERSIEVRNGDLYVCNPLFGGKNALYLLCELYTSNDYYANPCGNYLELKLPRIF